MKMPSLSSVMASGDKLCENGIVRMNPDVVLLAASDNILKAIKNDEEDLDEFRLTMNFEELDCPTQASLAENPIFCEP